MALTNAERQRAFRRRKAAGAAPVRSKRPTDRRSKPQRWADAVGELRALLDQYQDWRDNLPENLEESALAQKLEAVLELDGSLAEIEAAELPLGFGRD